MRSRHWPAFLSSLLLLTTLASSPASASGPSPTAYDRTLQKVLALLPRRPPAVAVFDADDAKPEVRQTLLKLDAFITRGGKVVYVVKQSAVLEAATKGAQLYHYMLASIIWHEMAHVDGADERGARRAEEQLWMRFGGGASTRSRDCATFGR